MTVQDEVMDFSRTCLETHQNSPELVYGSWPSSYVKPSHDHHPHAQALREMRGCLRATLTVLLYLIKPGPLLPHDGISQLIASNHYPRPSHQNIQNINLLRYLKPHHLLFL